MTADSDGERNGLAESQHIHDNIDEKEGESDGNGANSIGLAAGLPGVSQRHSLATIVLDRSSDVAEEAVLALVDFPKQIVIALAMTVKYMKGRSYLIHSSASG